MLREARQKILKTQKVLRGRFFDPLVAAMPGMAKLVDWVKFQSWEHQFELPVPTLHEKKVRMFYHNLTFSDDDLYLTIQVNRVSIAIDEEVLFEILGGFVEGTRSLRKEKGSTKILKVARWMIWI